MRVIPIKAIVITDGVNYFIHGSSEATPAQMFKTMMPLWNFDPSKEMAHFVEVEVAVPEFEAELEAEHDGIIKSE